MAREYQIDHLQFMQAQESYYRISADYLSSSFATITADDRHALCSWSYEIIESLSNINREVACIGMSYLDRFMATSSPRAKAALTTRHEYQLATVACLVLALKNRGGVKLGSDFVSEVVCHGLYTSDEIDVMEMEILQALSWKLNGPSPHEFIDALLGLLPVSSSEDGSEDDNASSSLLLSKYSKMQVDAAILEYDLALQTPQALAYAAILTSLRTSSDLTDHFCPMDLINWTWNIESVMAGSRMDKIFLKGLEDVIEITYFDDNMEDDTEDNTEDNDENKYEDKDTKDGDEVQSSRSDKVKVGRPLRMRRVSAMSWSAGDFDALSTASTMLYE